MPRLIVEYAIGATEMAHVILPDLGEPGDPRQNCSRRPETRGLLSILAVVESISKREGSKHLSLRLQDLHERIARDQFRLAVVGQFKRGKTSLLNALLKETDLLPVGTLPFTSVLTIVQHGSQKAAEVLFQSGIRRSISLSELKDYVTDAGNPNNCRMVDQVEVSCPAEILRGGIVLINCPGFGSLSDQNTEIAYNCLPRIDAAIFVTSPDPPITAAEKEFLRKLTLTTQKLFVVMNKVDLLDHGSLEDVLLFTKDAITRIVGDYSPEIYAVSALATASDQECVDLAGVRRLEAGLREFLRIHRDETFLASVLKCLSGSISELREELQSKITSVATILRDLESKSIRFEVELKAAYDEYTEKERRLLETVNRLGDLAENETLRFAESQESVLDSRLRAFRRRNGSMPKREFANALEEFATLEIDRLFNGFSQELEASLVRAVDATAAGFIESANTIVATVRESALQQFGVSPDGNLEIPDCFSDFCTHQQHESTVDASEPPPSLLLFPGPLLRYWVLHQALGTASRRLQQTGQVIGQDLKTRARAQIQAFADRVRKGVQDTFERIRASVCATHEQHECSAAFHRQHVARLSTDIARLDLLAEALNAPLGFQSALEA